MHIFIGCQKVVVCTVFVREVWATGSIVEQKSFLANPEKIRYKGFSSVFDSRGVSYYSPQMTPSTSLGNRYY